MRHRVLALFFILWLPLQSWAAVAMPFCKHATHENASTAQAAEHAGHAKHHHSTPVTQEDGHASFACNDCGVCHLACAPAMPPADAGVWITGSATQCCSLTASRSLFDPEQSKPPPIV